MTPPPCNHEPRDPDDMTHRQMVLLGIGGAVLVLLLWVLFVLYSPVLVALIEKAR